MLDQVTDPHNVGAVMRSAVAFGAGALITTSRHSPTESGVLAKSASGALEHIDLIEVRNLADALGKLHEAGFQTIGLDSDGPAELEKSFCRRQDRAGARRRGQGPAPEDARDRDRARPPRHARRHPLAQRVERGGRGALCGAAVPGWVGVCQSFRASFEARPAGSHLRMRTLGAKASTWTGF